MAARESGLGEESTIEYGELTRDDCQENAARQPPTPKHNHPEAMPQPRSGMSRRRGQRRGGAGERVRAQGFGRGQDQTVEV